MSRISSIDELAPRFRVALLRLIMRAQAAGLDATTFETMRTPAQHAKYYADGTTKAKTVWASWHAYGLAADIISASKWWNPGGEWWMTLGELATAEGLTWGGLWRMRDYPHVQWGRCRTSPSSRARVLHAAGGLHSVWKAVGAL